MRTNPSDAGRVSSRLRKTGLTLAAAWLVTLTAGCDAMNKFTGDPEVRWVGEQGLPKDQVNADGYRAVAAAPTLTPAAAATAFGLAAAEGTLSPDKSSLSGDNWSVSVGQSRFATTLKFTRPCGTPETSADAVIGAATKVLDTLKVSDDWTWLTFVSDKGAAKVVAEPNIDGVQTWTTGSFVAEADAAGLCAASAVLMTFEPTGEKQVLDSAYDTFEAVRHDEELALKGEYGTAEQTWTLGADGALAPLWHYSGPGGLGFVAVDLGDGLETAPDTATYLLNSDALKRAPEGD